SGRDIQHFTVVFIELYGKMVLERGRITPEIDDYVKDCPARTSYDFDFFKRCHLIVHAAERAFSVIKRNAALGNTSFQPLRLEFIFAKSTGKISPNIIESLRFDNISPRHFRRLKDHWRALRVFARKPPGSLSRRNAN